MKNKVFLFSMLIVRFTLYSVKDKIILVDIYFTIC